MSSFNVFTCVLGFTVLNNVTSTECYLRMFLQDIDCLSHLKVGNLHIFQSQAVGRKNKKTEKKFH